MKTLIFALALIPSIAMAQKSPFIVDSYRPQAAQESRARTNLMNKLADDIAVRQYQDTFRNFRDIYGNPNAQRERIGMGLPAYDISPPSVGVPDLTLADLFAEARRPR